MEPSGSELAVPSRTTVAPVDTVRAVPALATGGRLRCSTVMSTLALDVEPSASPTVSRNVSVVGAATVGATNVGRDVVAPASATEGPAVWAHAHVVIAPVDE